jgi:hypothetical protein
MNNGPAFVSGPTWSVKWPVLAVVLDAGAAFG